MAFLLLLHFRHFCLLTLGSFRVNSANSEISSHLTISDFDNFLSPGSGVSWKEKSETSPSYLENFLRYGQSRDPTHASATCAVLHTAFLNPLYVIIHAPCRPENVTAGTVFAPDYKYVVEFILWLTAVIFRNLQMALEAIFRFANHFWDSDISISVQNLLTKISMFVKNIARSIEHSLV